MNIYTKILLKKLIFSANFVLNFFFQEMLVNFVMKKKLQEITTNIFVKYFV